MPRLKVTHPDHARIEYQFGDQVVTIGREVDNLVVIDEPAISRHHAVIELIEGAWWLRDLGSSNGTLQQGKPIKRIHLEDRSSFEISGWKFRFTLAGGKSTAHPAEESKPSAKSRSKGKKGRRAAASAVSPSTASPPPPEPTAASQADWQASAILIPDSMLPEQSAPAKEAPTLEATTHSSEVRAAEHQPKAKLLPDTPAPSSVRRKAGIRLGWPLAAAGVTISLILVLGQKGGEKDVPPPQAVAAPRPQSPPPHQPLPPPPLPIVAMREAQPQPLPPVTLAPAKQVQPPPIAMVPRPDRPAEKPPSSSGKLLFAPGADHAGFQPVLSPRLDRVLHVKKAAGSSEADAWVDVCLNEELILRRVHLSTEDQMRFSQDGSAWAVQAQDEKGGKFIALQGRTIRLEGEVVQWLGNRDFSHMAVVSRHQGEDNLAIDGVWQSSYHHIRDLRLSEDGLQWAYVAMKFSPEDALEYPAGERVVTRDGPMPICQEVLALELAPQGGRVAWVAAHPGGKQEVVTAIGPVWQTPPGGDAQIQSLTLSNDGRRLAWACVTHESAPSFYLEDGGSWTLPLVAGRESTVDTRICFSPDGWHAVFAASGHSSVLMSEGGAVSRHSIILLDSLTFSPDGRRFAYVAMEPVAGAGNPSAQRHHASLWLDGKCQFNEENAWVRQSVAANRILMAGISSLRFSPDSHHLACLRSIQNASGKGYIRQAWLDGRLIPERHHHVLALAWAGKNILSLAVGHSENDSIELVDHRLISTAGN